MPAESKPAEIKEEKKERPEVKDQIVMTQHSIIINGEEVRYTVTAGTVVLKEENGREEDYQGELPKAQFFFVA